MRNPEISSAKGATFTESRSQNVPESQDKNNPRFSVRANPSSEEIAEAKRQKEEVKAKRTNPDGSMKRDSLQTANPPSLLKRIGYACTHPLTKKNTATGNAGGSLSRKRNL